jgi:hypothetical protein
MSRFSFTKMKLPLPSKDLVPEKYRQCPTMKKNHVGCTLNERNHQYFADFSRFSLTDKGLKDVKIRLSKSFNCHP